VLLFNVYAQSFIGALLSGCSDVVLALLIRVPVCSYFFVEEIRSIWSEGFSVYRQVFPQFSIVLESRLAVLL
jgi:hypothetical protein